MYLNHHLGTYLITTQDAELQIYSVWQWCMPCVVSQTRHLKYKLR